MIWSGKAGATHQLLVIELVHHARLGLEVVRRVDRADRADQHRLAVLGLGKVAAVLAVLGAQVAQRGRGQHARVADDGRHVCATDRVRDRGRGVNKETTGCFIQKVKIRSHWENRPSFGRMSEKRMLARPSTRNTGFGKRPPDMWRHAI